MLSNTHNIKQLQLIINKSKIWILYPPKLAIARKQSPYLFETKNSNTRQVLYSCFALGGSVPVFI